MERGHTLILGWSNKVRWVLDFLDATDRKQVVVILAPMDIGRMQDALKADIQGWTRLEIVLRSGSTSRLSELERVGLATAGKVISLAYDQEDEGQGEPDIEAIKTLMLLSACQTGKDPPAKAADSPRRHQQRPSHVIQRHAQ